MPLQTDFVGYPMKCFGSVRLCHLNKTQLNKSRYTFIISWYLIHKQSVNLTIQKNRYFSYPADIRNVTLSPTLERKKVASHKLLTQVEKKIIKKVSLVLNWFDFHLSSFSGIGVAFPVIPVHTFPASRVFSVKIKTVEIRNSTDFVPPGSLRVCGTVTRMMVVVVTIFGGERRATVIAKRVTSSS